MQMITGTGPYASVDAQVTYDHTVRLAVQTCHSQALGKLDSPGSGTAKLVGLKQRGNESPTDFVSRVQTTVQRTIGSGPGSEMLISQLVREGLKSEYAQALTGLGPNASIEEIVERLLDVPPKDPHQAMAMALVDSQQAMATAVAKGVAEALKDRHTGSRKCYQCGREGQFKAQCRSNPPSPSPRPTCYCCGKVGHIAKFCRQRQNTPLRPGNGGRGPTKKGLYPVREQENSQQTPVAEPCKANPLFGQQFNM